MNELKKQPNNHSAEWANLLSEYLDNRLEVNSRHRVERHLAECRECRLEMVGLRRTVKALNNLPEVRAPRSFTLSPAQAQALRPRPLYRASQFAAAVAAAFLVISFILDFSGAFSTPSGSVVAVGPTVDVAPVIGTRPPTTCRSTEQNCAQSGAKFDPATPDPTTVAPTPAQSANSGFFEPIRLVQLVLVVLLIGAAAFAYALRPRAPSRLRL